MGELEKVQAKYPHVIAIIEKELNEFQYSTQQALAELPTSRMTDKLIAKIEQEIIAGKRKFKFYEIECNNCARTRVIKPQDAFQVKNCGRCGSSRK